MVAPTRLFMTTAKKIRSSSLETHRRKVRQYRASPDDKILRRMIIRQNGQSFWLPALMSENIPVPAEIWVQCCRQFPQNHIEPSSGIISWDFVGWYQSVCRQWSDRKIDFYFLNFDPSLIPADFFDKVRGIKDRNLPWKIKLLTDGKNIASTAVLDHILRSALDEIHIYVNGLGESSARVKVLGAVKDLVDLRTARMQNHPEIICRLCPKSAGETKLTTQVSRWAKQVGIDRLDIADKELEEKRLWAL